MKTITFFPLRCKVLNVSRWLAALSLINSFFSPVELFLNLVTTPVIAQSTNTSKSQSTQQLVCGYNDAGLDVKTLPYYGNNKYLLKVLQRNKVTIDTNYFDDPAVMQRDRIPKSSSFTSTNSSKGVSANGDRNPVAVIPIKVWVHRRDDGTGGIDQSTIESQIQSLDGFYSGQANIRFYLRCNISYVNNSSYYDNPSESDDAAIFDNYWEDGCINVHYIYNSTRYGGLARRPNAYQTSFCCIVCFGQPNSVKALYHEIGHTLGLRHTHDRQDPFDDCFQEFVSRTELSHCHDFNNRSCDVNADNLCDTPADPNLDGKDHSGCTYYNLGHDVFYVDWQPDPSNVMSYAARECLSTFTMSQIAIMYDNIPPNINNTSYYIGGPLIACVGQATATSINPTVAGASNYTWSITNPNWPINGQGSVNITFTATDNNGAEVSVMPNCGSLKLYKPFDGLPSSLLVSGPTTVSPGDMQTYDCTYVGHPGYNWNTSGTIVHGTGSTRVDIWFPTNVTNGYVTVSTSNPCGGSDLTGGLSISCPSCGARMGAPEETDANQTVESDAMVLLYPNPSKGRFSVQFNDQQEYDIEIVDVSGRLIRTVSNVKKRYSSPFSLLTGLFLLKFSGEGQTVIKRLLIE